MTRSVRKKNRTSKYGRWYARWLYLLFWCGAGAASSLLIIVAIEKEGSSIPFGILNALTLSFLIMCGKYKFRPAMFSLAACCLGQIAAAFLLHASSVKMLFFSCTLVTIVSYPCWFWLVRPDWEQTAGRWFLYFVLLVTGLLAAPSRRLLFILLLLVLIAGVHLYINGEFKPIRTNPNDRRKGNAPGLPAQPTVGSLQSLMLDRARRSALRKQAQKMVAEHEKRSVKTADRKDAAQSHSKAASH